MDKLENNVLYVLDKCFRTYHQFAQKQVKKAGHSITIDQWLLLKNIHEHPHITQNELARTVFKDNASVTRIIQGLVIAGYVDRSAHATDRRRVILELTPSGVAITEEVNQIALKNRAKALQNISTAHVEQMKQTLENIIQNCK
ncbi:MAG: MarR family transcriptional regulator [Pedobacter sp.]|nr:MAG: MarR family transcriptional regulator [Pedobacter sp.]